MRLRRYIALAGVCAAAAAAAQTAAPATPIGSPATPIASPATPIAAPAVMRIGSALSRPTGGFTPAQIQRAYNLGPLLQHGTDGTGQTIAIIDPFGSPTIRHDLTVFDAQFGLGTSLKIIQPAGRVSKRLPTVLSREWAAETTLDVEWAHVMAPAARILLVETPATATESSRQFIAPIIKAARYVINHRLAGVISQSLDITEQALAGKRALIKLSSVYRDAARLHVTVVAATGDEGATNFGADGSRLYLHRVVAWPASNPLVTAVGGASLHLDASGARTAADQVWSAGSLAGGGGRSAAFGRPGYQRGPRAIVHRRRGVPDIAMSAGCSPGVDVYESFKGLPAGWSQACGTSEAAPLLAGIIALADQQAGHPLGLINPALYQMAAAHLPGIVDITKGNNTVTFSQGGKSHTVPGFAAGTGYDLASGLGSVNGAMFVPELAKLARG
jgi:subtilase family serine protease